MLDTSQTIDTSTVESFILLKDNLEKYSNLQASTDFLTFVKIFAPTLVSDFKMGKHIELLCQKLQGVVDGNVKRLMVFLPPRSSKSLICSKLFPAWYIGNFSNHEIMSVSHSDQLASDFGRTVRDIVNTTRFQRIFKGVSLRSDVKAAGKWKTNKHGSYYAAGVRSQVAGRGANVALLDDVMSEEDSFSEAGRRYIKEWYPAGLRTRLMPNGSIIIINTRYHYDDLCGWLLKQEQNAEAYTYPWEVISIPAWLDETAAELLQLPEGSSYFPEWKTDEILKIDEQEIRASNGARYWNSLYMQDPSPDDGGIIKKKWFQWWDYEEPPVCQFIIQTYDTAFSTRKTADYSVIQTWGIFSDHVETEEGGEVLVSNLILLGNTRGRFEYPELRRIAQDLYKQYRPDVCIIEKKASGQSLIQDMRRAGLPVLDYLPDRDKVARVYASTPLMESKRVWIPKDKVWADDLFSECMSFPNGSHDDQVDCMTMAIHYMKDSWNLIHPEDPNWEDDTNHRKQKRIAYWRT
jgi:predicted phage terminase large subunit-like protein